MIAHNLPFDYSVLSFELARCAVKGFVWPRIGICTVQEHAEEWGRRPKLTELYAHYVGEDLAQSHRALDDVTALFKVACAAGVV
jgi:DNA polymerase III epsilon subunit-like protein